MLTLSFEVPVACIRPVLNLQTLLEIFQHQYALFSYVHLTFRLQADIHSSLAAYSTIPLTNW